MLLMTATPIPRTLALTLYGDLDVSALDELPPGRRPIVTRVFHQRQRERVLELVRRELDAGRQAYVVCPLVSESEKTDLLDATRMARELAAGPLASLSARPRARPDASGREGRRHAALPRAASIRCWSAPP